MREPHFQYYDKSAKKQTVSLTINSDLYARAKEMGLNASQVTEEALARLYTERMREQIRQELREEAAAYDAFVEKHGSLAEMARQHYAELEDAQDSSVDDKDAV